jgi:twitching motility protein PilT
LAFGKRQYVEQALSYLVTKGGSDLHLSAGSPPHVRLHGSQLPIPGTPSLSPEDTQELLDSFLSDPQEKHEFAQDNEVDFSFELTGTARFRVNAYRQRGSVSMVLRAIPFGIRTITELDLPPVVEKLANEERGRILVTDAGCRYG